MKSCILAAIEANDEGRLSQALREKLADAIVIAITNLNLKVAETVLDVVKEVHPNAFLGDSHKSNVT